LLSFLPSFLCRPERLICALACLLQAVSVTTANAQTADWPAHNRSIALQGLHTQQNYREIDTSGQTADGSFNTERGHWQGTALQLRWQGTALQLRWQGQAGPVPLWLQAQTTHSSGQTDYQGYLQSGSQLTPYQARTGNTTQQHSLRLGWPVDAAGLWPFSSTAPLLQIVPYVDWAHQRWQRNLVQYGETYTHQTRSLGVLAQWQVAPAWVLEAGHQQGRHSSASLSAPSLGFAAPLGRATQKQSALALHWQAGPRWSLQLQAAQTRYTHGASATVNDLQAPPSTSTHTQLGASVAWHY
jgi:hypothetical protein